MKTILIGFIVLCGLFKYGSPIMCYECNSSTNSFCLEKELPESLKRNCSDHDRGVTHTLCRKIIQYVDHSVKGKYPESRVIRSCGWDESKYKDIGSSVYLCNHHYTTITILPAKRGDYGITLHLWRRPSTKQELHVYGDGLTTCHGQCYHRAGYGGRQEVCSCVTDYCNAASGVVETYSLLILTSVLALGRKLCQ